MLEYRVIVARGAVVVLVVAGGVLAIPRLLSFSYLVLVTEMGFCTAIARGRG